MAAGSSATSQRPSLSTALETTQPASRPRIPRFPARIGADAGLVVCALLLGIGGGLVWGWLRPAYVGTADDGRLAIDQVASPENVEFAATGWFSLITLAIGVVLAVVALRQFATRRTRGGLGSLCWLIACAVSAVLTVAVTGDVLAAALHPLDHANLADGQQIEMVPPAKLGAAWLVGPFVSSLIYWAFNAMSLVVERDEPPTD